MDDQTQNIEGSQEEVKSKEPIKPVDNRQPNGQFGPGNNANPWGRPEGSTLKEYQGSKYRKMTDEQKEVELSKMSEELKWRMAEGNPHQTNDTTVELKPSPLLDAISNNQSNPQDTQAEKQD